MKPTAKVKYKDMKKRIKNKNRLRKKREKK
jgi:hypothetical protein